MDEPPRFRQSSRKFARAQRQNMTRAPADLAGFADVIKSTDMAFADKRRSDRISRILFVSREKSSWKRTAARTRRRMRRSRTPRGMHGFEAPDFAFFDFPTNSSSADWRSSSSAFARRCARHEFPFPQYPTRARPARRKTGRRARGDGRAIRPWARAGWRNRHGELLPIDTGFPHPIRPSAIFPASRRRGNASPGA